MDEIRLQHAFVWACPSCEQQNVVAHVPVSLGDDDDTRDAMGLDPWQSVPPDVGGEWYMSPEKVMCRSCGKVFKAIDPSGGAP